MTKNRRPFEEIKVEEKQPETRKPVYRSDYRAPDFLIPSIQLSFDIFEDRTRVYSRLQVKRHSQTRNAPLSLNGENLKLISIQLNGVMLDSSGYFLTEKTLMIPQVPDEFILEIQNEIEPHKNEALEGLYQSGNIFCTQNEPEGFRKITYFIDRPDVMSKYTTRISADRSKYPVLLSNGNEIERGDLEDGRHYVVWEDPFNKPCYLFALVAGDLGMIEDRYVTKSGRPVTLRIFVEKGNEPRAQHAMSCLKQAMKWDENEYGLECDLNTYMIVGVDAFNQGAMENKGLNIFNSSYVLADPKSATDDDFKGIQSVIAHEYFHNWTGNRVTCRDWFQLTLKEGLTVFRDQEFSADMTSRAVQRISDVRTLRSAQFVEDGGPHAHPPRPDPYFEMNNFYTSTVYNKGSEIYRMLQVLLGKEKFRKGIEKYFELFDGGAVTVDDFILAMEKASGENLQLFKRWFDRPGTPVCRVTVEYDQKKREIHLILEQKGAIVHGKNHPEPFCFPFCVGFLDGEGKDIALQAGRRANDPIATTNVLKIHNEREEFVFLNMLEKPVPSLLRRFSAPIKLEFDYSVDELLFLLEHDSDGFNRYEAGHRLARICLNDLVFHYQKNETLAVNSSIVRAYKYLLNDKKVDYALAAEILTLPPVSVIVEDMDICDFEAAFYAREFFMKTIAVKYENLFLSWYQKLNEISGYLLDIQSISARAYKNICLRYLVASEKRQYIPVAYEQFRSAANMTDEIAALSILCQTESEEKEKAIRDFRARWESNRLVIDKWFAVQSLSKLEDTIDRVRLLARDPLFDSKNSNPIRALYGSFSQNLIRFHDVSGAGYQMIADQILEIDRFNSHLAARLANAFKKFKKLDPVRKELMKSQLDRILSAPKLSSAVYEIVSKTL